MSPKKKSEEKAKKQPKEATSGSSESDPSVVLDPTVEANRMADQLLAVRKIPVLGDSLLHIFLYFIFVFYFEHILFRFRFAKTSLFTVFRLLSQSFSPTI